MAMTTKEIVTSIEKQIKRAIDLGYDNDKFVVWAINWLAHNDCSLKSAIKIKEIVGFDVTSAMFPNDTEYDENVYNAATIAYDACASAADYAEDFRLLKNIFHY
jgi:hypothetical protein